MISARSISCGIVDQQRAALAAGEILGLVETLRRQCTERAEIPALVLAEQPVGIVLHHGRYVWRPAISRMASISQPTPA